MASKRLVMLAGLLLGVAALFPHCIFAADTSLPRIIANDNRQAAGAMKDGVLSLRLEIREGELYPEAENGPHVAVCAFAEEGKSPMVPGPLLRVPEGTQVRMVVKNTLDHAMEVHGLFTRPGKDSLEALAAGESRELSFPAGAPGTYYYYALDPLRTVGKAAFPDAFVQLLTGAFVVDGAGSPPPRDRIFVVNLWRVFLSDAADFGDEFGIINGKSWPYTERLSFALGDSVHWRVINASVSMHPMHLHGAYYRVDAYGNGESAERFPPEKRQMVVTRNMDAGDTMDLTWKPDRPGHWLFHCHIIAHIMPENSLSAVQNRHAEQHGVSGMAGLVLATEVLAPGKFTPAAYTKPRRLKLVVNEVTPKQAVGLELSDGESATASVGLMGPPIILHRGEASEIEVVNHLKEPTAIHWHGMELESYYDGVPDFSGIGKQIAPPIEPGKSFIARMTPPRAGTFIYHTHWHDVDQLGEGLYGPLIVLDPGQEYQPERDMAFVAGLTVKDTDGPLLVNGSAHPEVTMRAGRIRLRLINITPNNTALRYSLTSAGKRVNWQAVAKDGMDLPTSLRQSREATQKVGVGETYDFAITAAAGDELNLEGFLPGPKLKTNVTIHVR